jgi:hypothetical protein
MDNRWPLGRVVVWVIIGLLALTALNAVIYMVFIRLP